MGIFSRRAAPTIDLEQLTTDVVEKLAGMLPKPTPVLPASQQPSLPAAAPIEVLPRTDFGGGYPFGPGIPLVPIGIDPREPVTGRPAPRRSEFASSVNLQVNSTRLLPFPVLRDVAERVDIIRRCIELRKSQMLGLDWDIVLTRQALKRLMLEENITSLGRASQIARDRFAPDMTRLRQWWQKPDRYNGQNFSTWLSLLMEEQLVVDAATIYPRRQGNGDVGAFEILDGTTIKPLLDHRGSTPVSPNPAYQQILYGFPRGEFTASNSDGANGYRFDQLVYRPRYVRTWTPFGCPNTEQALAAADLYLKRMNWIRSEFTEGTTPDTWLKSPDTLKISATDIRAYEAAINAELAGDDAARRHLRMLPPGWEADQMTAFADLYKPELDELLIKLLCACFDVMPTEIGFPPGSGIGGKGHQEGEANSSQRKAVRPTATWVENLLTDLSRDYLGMPEELEFKLLGYETEDQNTAETVADSQVRRGGLTMNDDRAARGMPLFDFEEADEPFMVTGAGITFLRGAMAAQEATVDPAGITDPTIAPTAPPAPGTDSPANADADPGEPLYGDTPEDGDPIAPEDPVPDGYIRVQGHIRRKQTPAAAAEAAKFLKFAVARAGKAWRDFKFADVTGPAADRLNAAGRAGDLDLVKALVGDVGKAKARRVSRATKDKLVKTHATRIADKVAALLPSPADLIAGWTATKTLTANQTAAREYLEDELGDDYADLDDEIATFMKAGHKTAYAAAWIIDDDPDDDKPTTTALGALLDKVPGSRDILIGIGIGLIADALISTDPEANVATVIDGHEFVDSFTETELTGSLSAGALDSAQAQEIYVVRIVASDGDCDFCAGYDGRILHLDETSGMPPLHRGCSCEIEPLEPLEN